MLEPEFNTLSENEKTLLDIKAEEEFKAVSQKTLDVLRTKIYYRLAKDNESSYLPYKVAVQDDDEVGEVGEGDVQDAGQERKMRERDDNGAEGMDDLKPSCYACPETEGLTGCHDGCPNM